LSVFLNHLSIQTIVDDTLAGFAGVELVEIERLPKGLLSITIDEPSNPLGVGVAHCEQITRQLQAVFFVEEIAYERLEVGSPGVNRPLQKHADFVRFAGERVTVKLRETFQNRKTYTGILQAPTDAVAAHVQTYDIAVESQKLSKTQQKKLEKSLDLNLQKQAIALNFKLDEIESVRLDPHLDFKGKNHE
jgi:ribosome maturation factor RimP